MATKQRMKIDPNATYESIEGFSGTNDAGVPVNVRPGARLRGDSYPVSRWPHFFVPFGTDDGEKERRRRELAGPRTVPVDTPAASVLTLEGPDIVAAIDTFTIGHDFIVKGQRYRDSHPLVRKWPECFKRVES